MKKASLEAICAVLGDTSSGLTGGEIGELLRRCSITDVYPSATKRFRLYEALSKKQDDDNCSNNVINFIQESISPQRYISNPGRFNKFKMDLNKALAFEGYEIGNDGLMRKREQVATSLFDVDPQVSSWSDLGSIFKKKEFKLEPNYIFLLIPLTPAFKRIYDTQVIPALRTIGYHASSADQDLRIGAIIEQIWESIGKSRLIIADVTGRNPNVFYELGLAHAINKDCIIVTQNENDVPFDIQHLRYLKYSDNEVGWKKFVEDLTKFMQAPNKRTPSN